MANSRLEKIGTIYSRTKGLIQSGALQWQDRPLWYDLYTAFPPKEEPRFDRPAPQILIKKIFYDEDKIRAMFYKRNKQIGIINLSNANTITLTQKFISVVNLLEKQYGPKTKSIDKIYEEAIEMLQKEKRSGLRYDENVKKSMKDNAEDVKTNVKINEIFKE